MAHSCLNAFKNTHIYIYIYIYTHTHTHSAHTHTHAKHTPTNAAEKEQRWNSEVGRGQKAWKSLLVKKYGGKTN